MRSNTLLLIVLAGLFTLCACRKDKDARPTCEDLKVGIASDDREAVKKVINILINKLPPASQKHTSENLAKLTSAIGQQCQVTATVLCFACIDTLPQQSEIRISLTGPGFTVVKVIDISSDKDDNMIFANMHN
jgi:hypothetical protein